MQLSLFFHALAMLCGLAPVAFVTLGAGPRSYAAIAAGFVLGTLAVRPGSLPDPVWVGSVVAALAAAALMRPRTWPLVAASGGGLAGVWVAMLEVAGTPLAAALPIAMLPVGFSVVLTGRRPDFAPPALREEALLVILVLGIAVAVAPGVSAGWQSAAVLNLQPQEIGSQMVPAWALLLTLGAATLGGLYTVWMRR